MARVRIIGTKKIKEMPKASSQEMPKYKRQRGQYVDPDSYLYSAMTKKERLTEYLAAAKAAERRLREIEKKGLADVSMAYRMVEQSGRRRKSGAVGFSTAGSSDWNKGQIKREYIQVYKFLSSTSSSISKKSIAEMEKAYKEEERIRKENIAASLAKQGIDYERMLADRKRYEDELEEFWWVYGQARKLGLFTEFNITNHYEQEEVIARFLEANPGVSIKSKRSAINIASNANRMIEDVRALSSDDGDTLKDDYYKTYFRDNYSSDKMRSLSSSLLQKMAEKAYGTTPPVKSISFDPERLIRRRK